MNSSTSSFSFRRFGLGFLLIAFVPGLSLFYLGVWLEPLAGDLTRIGGFSERDFGWQTPQLGFKDPLPVDEATYQYRDLWVLGDSFATAWPKLQWQNHFREQTGWSVGTQNINRVSIHQLLMDPEFKAHPPKVLILESAERYLTLRLSEETKTPLTGVTPRQGRISKARWSPTMAPQARLPVIRSHVINDIKIPFVGRYLLRSFQREYLHQNQGNAISLALKRDDLFSNRRAWELLIFREDLQKEALWERMGIDVISARLQTLRERVESNGFTQFVVLIAPDKLTAYMENLEDGEIRAHSNLSALIERLPHLIPNTLGSLRDAIQKGRKDIYLPDDTHWGSAGQEVISHCLVDFLEKTFNPR